jgi:hypothetical protein
MKAGKTGRAGVSLLAAAAATGLVPASASAAVATTSAGSPRHAVTAASSHYRHALRGSSDLSDGALFGGTVPLVSEERRLGRKLAMVRVYYHFGEDFPIRGDLRLMADHQTLLVSLDGTRLGPTFASVAAGREDRFIRPFLEAMNGAAVLYHLGVIYFCYQHEPNTRRGHGLGTPPSSAGPGITSASWPGACT